MSNFLNKVEKSTDRATRHSRLEQGVVLSTAKEDSNLSDHTVKVNTPSSGQIEAEVLVTAGGDFYLPPVDSIVTIAYYADETPAIVGCEYKDLDIQRLDGGERRIGHNNSNSHIFFNKNGDIKIENDDGQVVQITSSGISITLTDGTTADLLKQYLDS